MAPRSRRPAPRWAAAALAVLLALPLAACSWRLESPPPPLPTPDAREAAREAAARALARLQAALESPSEEGATPTTAPGGSPSPGASAFPGASPAPEDAPDEAALRALLADAVPVQVEALGGVYLPYPESSPSPSPALGPVGSVADEARAARDALVGVALSTEDPALALLTASAGLFLAVALGEPGPWGEPDPPSAVPAEELAGLLLAHDRAVYVYDVIAARSSRTPRQAASARALAHDQRARPLAALAPDGDPRRPLYQLEPQSLADAAARDALARQTERGVADAYLAALAAAGPDQRAWLLAGAYASLEAAAAWPGYEPGELPPLPGVASPGTATPEEGVRPPSPSGSPSSDPPG